MFIILNLLKCLFYKHFTKNIHFTKFINKKFSFSTSSFRIFCYPFSWLFMLSRFWVRGPNWFTEVSTLPHSDAGFRWCWPVFHCISGCWGSGAPWKLRPFWLVSFGRGKAFLVLCSVAMLYKLDKINHIYFTLHLRSTYWYLLHLFSGSTHFDLAFAFSLSPVSQFTYERLPTPPNLC